MSSYVQKRSNLALMLVVLTIMLMLCQGVFFIIHYRLSEIVDVLASTSILGAFSEPKVLLPLISFFVLQIALYLLLALFVWFVSVSIGELLRLQQRWIYGLGIIYFALVQLLVYAANGYLYAYSFFVLPVLSDPAYQYILLQLLFYFCSVAVMLAYINCGLYRRHLGLGGLFIVFGVLLFLLGPTTSVQQVQSGTSEKPNIILIGIDSLRPDRTHYFGDHALRTPTIRQFMQDSLVFSQVYTPLARTFPSWVSILTAKYPLHSQARANLVESKRIAANDTLAKQLKANGYLTVFAIDEPRFADITTAYGFDRVLGPNAKAVKFILGALSDFPLTNLLVNLPLGRYLLPYSYGNRAVDITYRPERFLSLIKEGLAGRKAQPVFLAVHLCLTHWPFRFAQDGQSADAFLPQRYDTMIEAADKQLAELMQLLRGEGLLDHALVVLLSDHGVTLGERHDRLIAQKTYQGQPKDFRKIMQFRLSNAPTYTTDFKQYYFIDTSYGQGTDVLSLKQYRVVLAMRGFGLSLPVKRVDDFVSLMDLAPTILQYQKLPPLAGSDGTSLTPYFVPGVRQAQARPFYIETADRMAEIETSDIEIDKVVQNAAHAYLVDKDDGLLKLSPLAEKNMIAQKQRAVLLGDWLLARYPGEWQRQKVLDAKTNNFEVKAMYVAPYYVLVNLKTGSWTIGLNSKFAKTAPVGLLMQKLRTFYGAELCLDQATATDCLRDGTGG